MASKQYSTPKNTSSPLPRSRSDFNYVGLSPKQKRWSTDFSLLLPPFSRDSSGYCRLAETPVTLQPRKHCPALAESRGTNPRFTRTSNQLSRKNSLHSEKPFPETVQKSLESDVNKQTVMCRSSTMGPLNSSQSLSTAPEDRKRLSWSPLIEQRILPPNIASADARCSSHYISATVYKNSKTCPKVHTNPFVANRAFSSRSPINRSSTLDHLRSAPSMPRSPTLDPGVLSRSPRLSHDFSLLRKHAVPFPSGCSEVCRSQSMRSLRRSSPSEMKLSNSAQGHSHRSSPLAECDEEDVRRLRNFTATPRGLVNCGDSFRSPGSSQWDVASTRSDSYWGSFAQRHKIVLVGTEDVGKTSLIRQFQTSEFICAFDTTYDVNKEYAITVILNQKESELEFTEYRLPDEECGRVDGHSAQWAVPPADAHIVVYSVTSRRSFARAAECVAWIKKCRRSAVLLVGNKSDLVRVRAVTTDEAAAEAREAGVAFLETSAAINHQVDELLVCSLAQIRAGGPSRLARARALVKRLLKKACLQSRSADNLQRL